MKDNISISAYELYRQSIERMPVHIYWKDKNFQYINCNLLQANDVILLMRLLAKLTMIFLIRVQRM